MLRTWLRAFVRDSILSGVADAMETLAGGAEDDAETGDKIATLRLRLALPQPTNESKEEKKKRGVG